jgi:hypothetical protein
LNSQIIYEYNDNINLVHCYRPIKKKIIIIELL